MKLFDNNKPMFTVKYWTIFYTENCFTKDQAIDHANKAMKHFNNLYEIYLQRDLNNPMILRFMNYICDNQLIFSAAKTAAYNLK